MTVAELKKVAKDLGVEGYRTMNKTNLIKAIEETEAVDKSDEVEDVIEEVDVKTEAKPEKKREKLKSDDEIEIMNNTSGSYGYIGRSGFSVAMSEYGDVVDIPFGELKRMKAEQSSHINEAYIIILNEQAVEELYLENLYKNIFDRDKVEYILKNPDQLAKALPRMPKSMKETVGSLAIQRLKSGEIFDMRIKKAVEDALGITIDV